MFVQRTKVLVTLVVLSTLTVLSAALVSVAQMDHAHKLQQSAWSDSISSQVYGLETQVTRMRGEVAAALATGASRPRLEPLVQRYEVMVSRVTLLHETRSMQKLRGNPAYDLLLPRLDELVRRGDLLFAGGTAPREQVLAFLDDIDRILPDVQGLTRAATGATTRLIDAQIAQMHRQAWIIGALAALQFAVLLVAIFALLARHRQQLTSAREQQQLADELREAKQAAEAATTAKSQFLANMSHELRTPFQGVLGMLQLLEKTPLTGTQLELVENATHSANHLLRVLNEILDISAIEAGKIVLREDDVDLQRLCRDVENLMRVQAESRNLDFRVLVDGELPRWVRGDATRIKQVLFNLLHNAIKFTPRGQVQFQAWGEPLAEGRYRIRFRVIDTGVGIDPATLGRLFRRFERGDGRLSRRFDGAGLGLEISRNLARLMGGDLVASSAVGQGSTFVLSLVLPPGQERIEPTGLPARSHRPLKVLVADDHPINRRYLALVLAALGHEAHICCDGQEVLDVVGTREFDVVLLDLHMPVLDGLAAAGRIRALGGAFERLPILAFTADVMAATREKALAAGVSGIVPKPVQMDQLASALAASVQAQPPAGEPAWTSPRFEEMARKLPAAQLKELLRMFFDDDAGALADLRLAVGGGDAGAIADAAHKVKGSARMLGLSTVAAAAQQIEDWAHADAAAERGPALLAELAAAVDASSVSLRAWLSPSAQGSNAVPLAD
jgi:signal transduction histidine kinase/CheY-like chemotaxis protein/HPt (histidine-containing phosphotransfer) domain-containing protein